VKTTGGHSADKLSFDDIMRRALTIKPKKPKAGNWLMHHGNQEGSDGGESK
jgi:hypothetical protein